MPADERRAQIVDAAARLISERGYWGLSLQDVADSCRITLSGLLHHFPSKEILLIAVLEWRDRLDEVGIERRLRERGFGFQSGLKVPSISEMCDAVMEQNAAQREVIRMYVVLQAEALTPEHPAKEFFERRQTMALGRLSALFPGEENAEEIARQLLALIDGISLQWLRDPSVDLLSLWRGVAQSLPYMSRSARRM